MNPKDEFISFQSHQNGKVTFAVNSYGHITHIVKRVDSSLYEVFSRLQKIRCVNLPIIFDLVKQADYLEVHEEYIRGRTVERLRIEADTLDDAALLAIAIDVCRALIAIHGTEPPIVHRDIKPENIMEREGGGYVLIDFDAARTYREDASTDTKCIATVGYAAPEQYGLSQTDVRSDLFSLGVTLYELKTGQAYHVGAKCDGILGKIIAKCTAFEPKKRFQSAEQLLRKLTALRSVKKRSIWIAAAAVIAATGILSTVFLTTANNAPNMTSASIASASLQTNDLQSDISYHLTTDKGLVIPFDEKTPITVQLLPDRDTDSSHTALNACRIDRSTLGADAKLSDSGKMTIYAEGAYFVSGYCELNGKNSNLITATVIATDKPEAYADCKCTLLVGKETSGLRIRAEHGMSLPADGGQLICALYIETFYDDLLCEAGAHLELMPLQGYVESAPEGANCGVTENNQFYTDMAGAYELCLPAFYKDEVIDFGCPLTVSESH